MSNLGQIERITQDRIIKLFQTELGYTYHGNWQDRKDNSNIEEDFLNKYLLAQGYDIKLCAKAINQLKKASIVGDGIKLINANEAVYKILRYGANVSSELGGNKKTIKFIDWENPNNNIFGIAEEVTVKESNTKRPDVVLYVNGIALGIIELKRSSVSVSEGIRQNLDNQKPIFIRSFFTSIQLVMAGNDTEGLRYGCINTPEKFYMSWKEENQDFNFITDDKVDRYLRNGEENILDFQIKNFCEKKRFLEIIHNFIVFDAGIKKTCRQNQYFGVKASQKRLLKNEGGVFWHSQGSGKSLSMVWLSKWIKENISNARILIITDRTDLDEQIEKVYNSAGEEIYRTESGNDLIANLNTNEHSVMCSLVHKFRGSNSDENLGLDGFLDDIVNIKKDFHPKGDIYVFIDECHRTQSGVLHKAMKQIIPDAKFIGFTGTPLLKKDKQKTIDIFGSFIHTYKFDEALSDGVILDLHYEARDINQYLESEEDIDKYFDLKANGLTEIAKTTLKKKWGNMQNIFSSNERLDRIVRDILWDMETKPRLVSGRGNALLVCSSIYQACQFYEKFNNRSLKGKCGIVTSYKPSLGSIKGEEAGEGETEKMKQFEIYQQMLAEYFEIPKDKAIKRAEEFEIKVKKQFKDEPGQMKLLIVVDKLLTGFDAPSASYLYIDKKMQDHGLFQAVCRVNRLHDPDKDYGYIVDYRDLLHSLESSVNDYTSGAFDEYDNEDIKGLLTNRLMKGKQKLDNCLAAIKQLCSPIEGNELNKFIKYFCGESSNPEEIFTTEPKRISLYKHTTLLIRAYMNIANEMKEAGYSQSEVQSIKKDIEKYRSIKEEIGLASGDIIDIKQYEPWMRMLLDDYIKADKVKKLIGLDEVGLIELIVAKAKEYPPEENTKIPPAMAETIENNTRRIIVENSSVNPKYYDSMSELLSDLINKRRNDSIDYESYLNEVKNIAKNLNNLGSVSRYPSIINTTGKKALFDALNLNEKLAIDIHAAIKNTKQAEWKLNRHKYKLVKNVIEDLLDQEDVEEIMSIIKANSDYD